jgi:hypothetical protein
LMSSNVKCFKRKNGSSNTDSSRADCLTHLSEVS